MGSISKKGKIVVGLLLDENAIEESKLFGKKCLRLEQRLRQGQRSFGFTVHYAQTYRSCVTTDAAPRSSSVDELLRCFWREESSSQLTLIMFDVALNEAGSKVVLSTSSDENFPPENMLDGKVETFWISTGMFPQEFVISFAGLMEVNNVKLSCYHVRGLSIHRSVHSEPSDFEIVDEKELTPSDASLQMEDFKFDSMKARHMKFIIKSGFDHFVSVHKLNIDGSAVRERD